MFSLKTHNVVDYVTGLFLILSPFLFGFAGIEAARNVFLLSGTLLVLYSLFTNYQFAVLRVIPLGLHMTLDILSGMFVIVAPWVFNYREIITPGQEYLHYVLGIGVFALVGMTREKTEADKRAHHIHLRARPAGI